MKVKVDRAFLVGILSFYVKDVEMLDEVRAYISSAHCLSLFALPADYFGYLV